MLKLLKNLWQHRVFVSVAFSETAASQVFQVRSFFVIASTLIAVGTGTVSYHIYQRNLEAEMVKRGEIPDYMKEKIARLEAEKSGQQNQIRMFAQELGILQARLDRFDAIGDKLFGDETLGSHLSQKPELGGRGGAGPEIVPLEAIPPIAELNEQLTLLSDRTDALDTMMNASIKLLATQEIEKTKRPYVWPVAHAKSWVTSKFGYRNDPFSGKRRFHGGTDFGAPLGTPIVSSGDGVVVFSGSRYAYGITVEIRHAHGFSTRYAHMQTATVKNGDVVKAGDQVGTLGSTGRSTGPHLHFEVLIDDTKIDPYPFIHGTRDLAVNLLANSRQTHAAK